MWTKPFVICSDYLIESFIFKFRQPFIFSEGVMVSGPEVKCELTLNV